MSDIWFISDTHFFHENFLKFMDDEGNLIRKFDNADQMNECIVEAWNARVKPQDKVYHLGDVIVGAKDQSACTALLKSLHGHLRLMLGNHDHIEQPAYRRFERIELWTGGKFKQYGFVASHIPLRTDQMRDGEYNVHGHTHQNLVRNYQAGQCPCPDGCNGCETPEYNPRYINVCVEHTNYAPIHLDEVKQRIAGNL